MDIEYIRAFFDRLAPAWDASLVRHEAAIRRILELSGIRSGDTVLDVACGTGVLIPDYFALGARSVTAVDLSPEMLRIARARFSHLPVTFLCGDAQTLSLPRAHRIMIYNALPHFPDPSALLCRLAGLLTPGGTLTVAHDMSREAVNALHSGAASAVSLELPDADTLAAAFPPSLAITAQVSDDRMYLVTGALR